MAWKYTLAIPALRMLREEDWEFEASLGCIGSVSCLKKKRRPSSSGNML
jgi:hypothetical protein